MTIKSNRIENIQLVMKNEIMKSNSIFTLNGRFLNETKNYNIMVLNDKIKFESVKRDSNSK
jgi:hypothetical protein